MSEQLRESLSAVIDGEAGEFELKRVLNELSTNEELRGAWDRYHLARSLLRREPGRALADDLPERLWARIEADESLEEAVGAEAESRRGRVAWLGPVTGVAVAAMVAVAVVLGVGLGSEQAPEAVVASVVPVQESMVAPAAVDPSSATPSFANPSLAKMDPLSAFPSQRDMQRTQAYMLHHARHTALNEQGSVLPFAKVAAFETR